MEEALQGGEMSRILIKAICFMAGAMLFSACAKIPQEIISPSLSLKAGAAGEAGMVSLNFTGGLKNENDSTVFLNVKGEVAVMDNKNNPVLLVPFTLPSILPFETGVVQVRLVKDRVELEPLMKEMGIDFDLLVKEGEPANRFPDENKVVLRNLSLEKKGIVEILKGKIK